MSRWRWLVFIFSCMVLTSGVCCFLVEKQWIKGLGPGTLCFFYRFFSFSFSRAGLGPGTLYFFSFVRELATPGVLHSENEIEKYLMKGLGPGTFLFCFFLKVLMNTLLVLC